MQIILEGLPKVSLNLFYAGQHWTKRKQIKDDYKILVKSQFKGIFSKNGRYTVDYHFEFKTRPLDASNCVAMTKIVEDIIFEDDKWDIVTGITITSKKGKRDKVTILVNELNIG